MTTPAEWPRLAAKMRRLILDMIFRAGSGHCGGSLSAVEILTALYFGGILRVRPEQPDWEERDRFILSKGHAAPALYAALAMRGFFPESELETLRCFGSRLQGHPDMNKAPGVDMSTGSLGMGLSNAIGMAWAASLRRFENRTFVLLGDGELNEGQLWEAAMLAAAHNFKLTAIVDHNGLQLDGACCDVLPPGDLEAKFRAFGWKTATCAGHDTAEIVTALQYVSAASTGPAVLLARTEKGHGVSFMAGNPAWHGKVLTRAEYMQACREWEE